MLPKDEDEEEDHSAEDMAEALQFQLRRLEAMQKAAENLQNLPQLGRDVFARPAPEGLAKKTNTRWDVSIYELFTAYGDIEKRIKAQIYDLPEFRLMSTDDAMERLTAMLGRLPRKGGATAWTTLQSFVDEGEDDALYARSSLSSTLTAGLELAKQGALELKQDGLFRPVYLRGTK